MGEPLTAQVKFTWPVKLPAGITVSAVVALFPAVTVMSPPLVNTKPGAALTLIETLVLEMFHGCRYLSNPGSVGQPRDRALRAAFAVYDDDPSSGPSYLPLCMAEKDCPCPTRVQCGPSGYPYCNLRRQARRAPIAVLIGSSAMLGMPRENGLTDFNVTAFERDRYPQEDGEPTRAALSCQRPALRGSASVR